MSDLDDPIYINPRKCGLLIRWAINHYGGITPALKAAEAVATWLLASNEACAELGETTAEHIPFYERFITRERMSGHGGDCYVAPSWLVGPVTCSACVYEEYVAKAFECLRIENSDP